MDTGTHPTHIRGARGEALAAKFLLNRGYTIIGRNYRDRISRGEIDLIVRQGECIVFVEVKAGNPHEFGPPETWVDVRKQRRVNRAATRYLQEYNLDDTECRFDVVGVTYDRGQPRIIHIENAFWSES